MLATEHVDTAKKFIVDAKREYEAGDIFQASEKLWGAANHVVIAEMQRRGMKAQKHAATTQFVRSFADEVDEPVLFSNFKVAEALHSNFYHGWMEDHQFEENRDLVIRFVDRMLELTNKDLPDRHASRRSSNTLWIPAKAGIQRNARDVAPIRT